MTSLPPPPTFWTMVIRVPETGVVKIPGAYPHEFASMPLRWRTVETKAKYVHVPILEGRLRMVAG